MLINLITTRDKGQMLLTIIFLCLLFCGGTFAATRAEQNGGGGLSPFAGAFETWNLGTDQDGPVNVSYGGVFQKGGFILYPRSR